MPVIKSAKKKLRQDQKRKQQNIKIKNRLHDLIKHALKDSTQAKIEKAIQSIDKAAKKRIIHKNKAARIKSKLSALMGKKAKSTKPKEKPTSSTS